MNKINVLIADDHAAIRSGLQRFIDNESDMQVIAEAVNGEEAYRVYMDKLPDILVMDVMMPGISGIEALQRIVSRMPLANVVMYTFHDEPLYASLSLNTGAKGYLTKASEPEELIAAIRLIHAGKNYISTDMAQKLALFNVTGTGNPIQSLTAREFEIFRLIARGRSVIQIADILKVGSKTIANHQTQIKHKLDINTPIDFVRMAMQYDLIENV